MKEWLTPVTFILSSCLKLLHSDLDSGGHDWKKQLHCAAEFLVSIYSDVLLFSALVETYMQNNSEKMKTKEIRQNFTDFKKLNSLVFHSEI